MYQNNADYSGLQKVVQNRGQQDSLSLNISS